MNKEGLHLERTLVFTKFQSRLLFRNYKMTAVGFLMPVLMFIIFCHVFSSIEIETTGFFSRLFTSCFYPHHYYKCSCCCATTEQVIPNRLPIIAVAFIKVFGRNEAKE